MNDLQKRDMMMHVFTFLFYVIIIFEGIIAYKNSDIFAQKEKYPLSQSQQFLIFFVTLYALTKILIAIRFISLGNMFGFYMAALFTCHRRVQQISIYKFTTFYVLNWILIGIVFILSIPTSHYIYKTMLRLNFKRIGANYKLVNAFIIRSIVKSTRELYFVYIILIILFQLYPKFAGTNERSAVYYRVAWLPFIFIAIYNEDKENKFRKIFEILVWVSIFAEIFSVYLYSRIRSTSPSFVVDIYICIIIFIYICFSIIDFIMYGSGLVKFYEDSEKKKSFQIE